jgi:hypothetical protein
MIWNLRSLIDHCNSTRANIKGSWFPARPLAGPFIERLRAAWWVLRGRADAFTWPEDQ